MSRRSTSLTGQNPQQRGANANPLPWCCQPGQSYLLAERMLRKQGRAKTPREPFSGLFSLETNPQLSLLF
uniref:Uncharacterized protein n=1 Tax=Strigops habroptila TaxID=2489341 RepID=A0A672U2T1_STRHB